MEGTGSGGFRLFAIIPRVGAIVLAVILLIVSAATIGVIRNNENLDNLQKNSDKVANLPPEFKDLLNLTNGSLGAAGWLIVMTIGIVVAEIIAIVLGLVNVQSTMKLIFGIIETVFSVGVILSYLATGIACAVYASAWRKPPTLCAALDKINTELGNKDDDVCDSIPLTATNALQAGFCFIQLGVFGLITGLTVIGLMKSRKQTT